MGKKYIIEIPEDKITDFVGSTHFLMPYSMAGHKGHHDTELPIKPYTDPDLEQVRKEAYDKAYADVIRNCYESCSYVKQVKKEAYQKGYETGYEDGYNEPGKNQQEAYQRGLSDAWEAARKIIHMPEGDMLNIFTECYSAVCTALQVILKYDASEAIEKLKDYEQEQEEIKVGDEVHAPFGTAVVTNIVDDKIWFCYADGHCGFDYKKDKPLQTGRHFPEIATVLEKMRGEQDG